MSGNHDEDIPYRSPVPTGLTEGEKKVSTDEVNFDTLKTVQKELREGMDNLDKWHAFDLQATEGLDLEQQVKAHQLAFYILAPILEAVESAMAAINEKYKDQ